MDEKNAMFVLYIYFNVFPHKNNKVNDDDIRIKINNTKR